MSKANEQLCIGPKVKAIQVHAASDLMGNLSRIVAGRVYAMELSNYGVVVTSKSSSRVVLVPFGNLQAVELLGESEPAK